MIHIIHGGFVPMNIDQILSNMRNSMILMAIIIATSGCIHKDKGNNETIHNHSSAPVNKLTLYNDSTEFFIEFPEPLAGHEMVLTVHLTRLSNYRPYPSGSVKVTVVSDNGPSSGITDKQVIPGIWQVPFKPGQAGPARLMIEFSANGVIQPAVSHSIRIAQHDAEAHVVDEAKEPEGIIFSKEQAWDADFSVISISASPFTGIIRAGGEILAMPGEKHFVHAPVTGMVKYNKNLLVAGADVAAGEVLLSITGQSLAASNIDVLYAQAEVKFEQSESEYQRHLRLYQENAISEKKLLESRSGYIRDSIHYYNLKGSYSGGGMKVSSPIDGYIHELLVSQGEFVEQGELIATLSSDLRLLLRADVPQQYYKRIGDIVSTNFRCSYHSKVWDIEELQGKLVSTGSSVQENNQYLPVYFEAFNNGQLLEGAYAEFFLQTRPIMNSILVPVSAVLEELGEHYVFVQTSGETYRKHPVRLGDSDGMSYRVIHGLNPGDRVVARGATLLRAISMSTSLPDHSHSH
jgi:RND family efflux transporter MFP subunit